ncbi:MAG: DUF222 domain-containing protein [Aeromicrobium sp.]
MDPSPALEAMRTTAHALKVGDSRTRVRAIQSAQDALDAAKAECLAEISASKDYELDGASTLNTWVRNELRLSASDANALVRSASTLLALPGVAAAAAAGEIRADHVAVFTYGLKHIGSEVVAQSASWLLDVAKSNEPAQLRKVMTALREAIFPDELDQAWIDGMDKQDIVVTPVPGGWHVSGFLNITAGAKFKKVMDSISAPRDKDDTRPGAERRVQGLDDLMTKILESGELPSDKGIRSHLSVIADADQLEASVGDNHELATDLAQLAGYGSIGPRTLALIACGADVTPILTRRGFPTGQSQILNVGRTQRCATLKQRRAVIARQTGICAAPGCSHTHLEIHHTIWWSNGGPTDLDLLIGLCVRCHHLVHRGLLNIAGNAVDGFSFTNRDNRPLLADYRRRQAAYREKNEIHKVGMGIRRRREARLIA